MTAHFHFAIVPRPNHPGFIVQSHPPRFPVIILTRDSIIHEDPFAPVTAIHNVINRASILDSQLPGHARRVALVALYLIIKN
jgi:hypothetical protein